jgi:hypothetical protein
VTRASASQNPYRSHRQVVLHTFIKLRRTADGRRLSVTAEMSAYRLDCVRGSRPGAQIIVQVGEVARDERRPSVLRDCAFRMSIMPTGSQCSPYCRVASGRRSRGQVAHPVHPVVHCDGVRDMEAERHAECGASLQSASMRASSGCIPGALDLPETSPSPLS